MSVPFVLPEPEVGPDLIRHLAHDHGLDLDILRRVGIEAARIAHVSAHNAGLFRYEHTHGPRRRTQPR